MLLKQFFFWCFKLGGFFRCNLDTYTRTKPPNMSWYTVMATWDIKYSGLTANYTSIPVQRRHRLYYIECWKLWPEVYNSNTGSSQVAMSFTSWTTLVVLFNSVCMGRCLVSHYTCSLYTLQLDLVKIQNLCVVFWKAENPAGLHPNLTKYNARVSFLFICIFAI